MGSLLDKQQNEQNIKSDQSCFFFSFFCKGLDITQEHIEEKPYIARQHIYTFVMKHYLYRNFVL
jgi:hypothetical protein